jgi:hypothetical protein
MRDFDFKRSWRLREKSLKDQQGSYTHALGHMIAYSVKKGNSHPKWYTKAVGIVAGSFLGSKNNLYQSIFSHR